MIKEIHQKEISIGKKIPLDDKKLLNSLRAGETSGIFQLESSGMRSYLKQLKPTEMEGVIAMVALYRPGRNGINPPIYQKKTRPGKKSPIFIQDWNQFW